MPLSPLTLDLFEMFEDKWNIAPVNLDNCSSVFHSSILMGIRYEISFYVPTNLH